MFFQERNPHSASAPSSPENTSGTLVRPDDAPLYPGSGFYPEKFISDLEKSIQQIIGEHSSGALLILSVTNLAMIINAYGHDTSEVVMHDLMKMIESILPKGTPVE